MSKENFLLEEFSSQKTPEAIYQHLITWGKKLPTFNPEWKTEERQVVGCQSLMYLHAEMQGDKIHFYAFSEALISAGLAALLLYYYEGETPEAVLQKSPTFLEKIGIPQALSPSRANGLASLYTQMKKMALQAILARQRIHHA